jgi:hypothetical protein
MIKPDRNITCLLVILLLLATIHTSQGQQTNSPGQSKKAIMKDTLDGKFDFSRFLIDAHGFIPVPFIITEPALGGFGGAIVPMFLTPKKGLPKQAGYVPPDITAGLCVCQYKHVFLSSDSINRRKGICF